MWPFTKRAEPAPSVQPASKPSELPPCGFYKSCPACGAKREYMTIKAHVRGAAFPQEVVPGLLRLDETTTYVMLVCPRCGGGAAEKWWIYSQEPEKAEDGGT